MRMLFLLIRVPFFILGVLAWLGIGVLALVIGFYVIMFMPLALIIWCIALLGVLIQAAFENNGTILPKFLLWSWGKVVGYVKTLGECIMSYPQAIPELWKWLLAQR